MIYKTGSSPEIEALFDGWEDTMIYSCLQGVMGQIYTNSLTQPEAAMAILGDFCFFAGRPERELVLSVFKVCGRNFMILTPRTVEWEKLIEECYGEHAERVVRYAIKKEPEVFDAVRLRRLAAALPEGYAMRRMETCRESREIFPVADMARYTLGCGHIALSHGHLRIAQLNLHLVISHRRTPG